MKTEDKFAVAVVSFCVLAFAVVIGVAPAADPIPTAQMSKVLIYAGDGTTAPRPVLVGTTGALTVGGSTVTSGTLTDRSGTITLGGTSQQFAAALSTRKYLLIQNNGATTMYFNFGTAAVATQPSISLQAGQAWENPPHFCPTATVNVLGSVTGEAVTVKEN